MSLLKHWILDDDHHLVEADLMTWARWFSVENRTVAVTETQFHLISTVFLGIDHSWGDRGPPITFETMVFQSEREVKEVFGHLVSTLGEDREQERYSTWDDAETGHKAMVRRYEKYEADALAAAGLIGTLKVGKETP